MRMSLYTGRNPGRLEAGLEEPLVTRDERSGIPTGHPTLPSLLADNGYNTAMFGKWHCGWLPWFSPLKIGFQEFFGNLDGAMDYFCHLDTRGLPDLYEGETPVDQDGYYTWLIADRATEYINKQTPEKPFYMQVNWNAPHWPWEGPNDDAIGEEMRQRLTNGDERNPLRHSDGGSVAKYTELVEAMDAGIGTLLDTLETMGLANNTIVIFCSDNGGERYSFMWPFTGGKGDIAEGGIRIPFILRWPAAIAGNQWSDATSITMDWTTTLLDAAQAAPHSDYPLDGVSLLPWLMDGADHPNHTLFWRVASQGALRKGTYKYVVDSRPFPGLGSWPLFPGVRHRLFDISGDGREEADIAAHHPEIVAAMRAEWEAVNSTLFKYPADHNGLAKYVLARLARKPPPQVSWAD
jgi:arylsulfatase A-like enzyme